MYPRLKSFVYSFIFKTIHSGYRTDFQSGVPGPAKVGSLDQQCHYHLVIKNANPQAPHQIRNSGDGTLISCFSKTSRGFGAS